MNYWHTNNGTVILNNIIMSCFHNSLWYLNITRPIFQYYKRKIIRKLWDVICMLVRSETLLKSLYVYYPWYRIYRVFQTVDIYRRLTELSYIGIICILLHDTNIFLFCDSSLRYTVNLITYIKTGSAVLLSFIYKFIFSNLIERNFMQSFLNVLPVGI